MSKLIAFIEPYLKRISQLIFSATAIAFAVKFIKEQLKIRAVKKSQEKSESDEKIQRRKIEFVETEWDRIGKELDKKRESS